MESCTAHNTRLQPHYSDLTVTKTLTLHTVFHLALRQTEGLIGSILQLLDLDLSVPELHGTDFTASRAKDLISTRKGPMKITCYISQ